MKSLPFLASLFVVFLGGQCLAGSGDPDDWGHSWFDSNEPVKPTFSWIDISSTGTKVVGDGDDVSSIHPSSGIGSPVELGFPVTFYGQTVRSLVPSSNGYLSTSATDAGGDSTPDRPLPAPPSGSTCSTRISFSMTEPSFISCFPAARTLTSTAGCPSSPG